MFSRISFKSQPDNFQLTLGFRHSTRRGGGGGDERKVVVEWSSADSDVAVLERLGEALSDPGLVEESVRARLVVPADAATTYGVVAASSFHKAVHLGLEVLSAQPTLDSVQLLRTGGGGSGVLPVQLAQALWASLELSSVTRVRCGDGGAGGLLDAEVLARLPALRVLNLSHCGLGSLPGVVGLLQNLEELRLVGNRLKMLPPELGLLRRLRILAADSNEIVILPGELRHCSALEELTLENNRLTSLLLNFRTFPRLQVLHLYNNPLEFLPEIAPCDSLRHLSVANMRVTADPGYSKFKVELLPASALSGGVSISLFGGGQKEDKLRPIFALMLRRSSGHHPLLAGALRQVAEQDPKNRELMARQENALQQLVLMALNDNPIVVEQTCATLRLLAQHSPALAEAIVENDASSVMMLLSADEERLQLASLQVLSAVAFESPVAAVNILTDRVLGSLEELVVGEDTSPRLRAAALEAVGNLAFAPKNRTRLQGRQGLMQRVLALAGEEEPSTPGRPGARVKAAAVRVLAVLGENDAVWRAVRRRPLISERGVRILSMDGGGMKGIATVRLLRELEARSGRRIQDMFDLICGTSTGGLLAVALGLRNLTLDDCEHIYKVLGQKVFSRPLAKQDKEETWMESFYRTFHSKTQHVRAVVVGYKHDAAVYESLLKEYCDFSKEQRCLADSMIDTACMDVPKVALVSTLASVTPAFPFVFRNYEIPPAREALARQIHAHNGSSKHRVWQAVRASSAATYYLDDFSHAGDKFQDGAVVANNPAIVALQEVRLLWPGAPIDVMVSLGSGSTPSARRGAAVSSFVETGSILIESACGVDRPAEALATLLPLVPGVKYFRFSPLDERCGMELDEIDPAKWAQLEEATQDYILTVAHKFDAAASALAEGLEPSELPPLASPTPADALSNLRLGPSRQLTLITSPSPAPAAAAAAKQQKQGVSGAAPPAAVFTTVVDVQRRERSRGRVLRAPSLRSPTPPVGGLAALRVGRTPPAAASAAGGGSQRSPAETSSRDKTTGEAGGSPATPGPGPAQDSARAAAAVAGQAAGPENPHPAVAAAGGEAAGSGEQGGSEGEGGGWFSWFSPRKQATLLQRPGVSQPAEPSLKHYTEAAAATAATGPPGQTTMQRSPANWTPDAAQRAGGQDGSGGGSEGSGGPDPRHHQQQSSFLTFSFGGGKAPAKTGAAAAAREAAMVPSSDEPGSTPAAAGAGGSFIGTPSAPAPAGAGVDGDEGVEGQSPADSAGARRTLGSPRSHDPAAGDDPAGFLASELRGVYEDADSVEVGACHLALAPAGEGLVLSWRQEVEAVLEPSDSARALLSHLGLEPAAASLSDLFEQQPCIPLTPTSSGGATDDGGSGSGSSSSAPLPGGTLGLLSRQVQWVAGRQLSVLLLQSTLPDVLLTEALLEGELRALLAQQVVVCASPLPSQLLFALLGGGGAVAVVCPRTPSNSSRGNGSSRGSLGEENGSSAGNGLGAGGAAAAAAAAAGAAAAGGPGPAAGLEPGGEEGAAAFFLAFYAALKGGATLMAALGVAESAQPALAGVYAVHGMGDGSLLVLPAAA